MFVIHNDLKRYLEASERVAAHGFITRSDHSGVWNCFPTVVSYCADIPELST